MPKKFNPKIADIARTLIGDFIAKRRKELGWTQEKVAEIADIRRATVNEVEAGRNYEINTLIAILGSLRGEIKIEWKDINSIPHLGKPDKN